LIDRVRERNAFVRLRRDGVRVRADGLWCSFVPDPELSPPQVAFAIGRAVGTAVRRNRVRRRLRALLATAALPPGLYLVGVRPGTAERTFVELQAMVTTLTSRVTRQVAGSAPR
jgi:ribonuclease P protein component